ncbi:MAG: malto-oligosyltrehalose synthase [Synechococcales bacterium]|nr:malto-oligosyltrehalose synthase [Synechococcales bacterium]
MKIPVATYRIQFNSDFRFADAEAIAPYLQLLGVSTLYASPIFRARGGSSHGYDVVDPRRISAELGDRPALESLVNTLHDHQITWLQDIVPNHMAYDSTNPFLMDVMEYGPNSEYYNFFDIQWEHPYSDIEGKVLAPLLGDFYGKCLERGEIQIDYGESGLHVNYYSLKFPLRIESYSQLITHDLGRLRRHLGREHPDFIKLMGILYLLKSAIADTSDRQYRDQVAFVKGLLWELYQSNPDIKDFIDHNIEIFNGVKNGAKTDPDESDTSGTARFDLLHGMLSDQYFRLSFWKVGAEELNYRRFFTVNELICVSVDDPKVFEITHSLIKDLVDEEVFDGVRIDHIDGLYHPKRYLERLRKHLGSVYITVEKILEPGETLPEDWPVQGTSGYEFLNHMNGLFCQSSNEAAFTRIYYQFTEMDESYHELEVACKRLIADKNLAGDVENLANLLKQIASRHRYASDFTLSGLRRAIVEVLVMFPVYRTYITTDGINERNRTYVQRVIQAAKRHAPDYVNEIDFIGRLFLLEYDDYLSEDEKAQWIHFVMLMQQFSGPLMAKGVEDTLLYIYHRLLSLNEVGGSPQRFGVTLSDFHGFNQQQVTSWPHSMNASSTHDTKRSEDVRARLNVLSEIPDEWEAMVKGWQQMNQSYKRQEGDRTIPDANDEYFLYQTLVGAFPFEPVDLANFTDRIRQYVIKAVREAKVHTAWLRPDTDYEEGFVEFVDAILAPREDNEFLAQLQSFQSRIAFYGMVNGLSQVLLKMTAPGVPDLYQGTEMWDFSLVDPDNRRPVDYDHRLHELQELNKWADRDLPALLDNLCSYPTDGRIKLYLTARVLAARAAYPEIFQDGDYTPVRVTGTHADRVVAFVREAGDRRALTVVPRFLTDLVKPGTLPLGKDLWDDTALELTGLSPTEWTNLLTQEAIAPQPSLPVGIVLSQFPVALLIG